MNSLETAKIQRSLIPGLTVATLILGAGSATAASFTLDTFNNTSSGTAQFVRSTQSAPNPSPNTQTGLTGVFGGSRQLQIDSTTLIPPSNPLIRTTILVSPTSGELSISNGASVISQTTSRYDANGVGLNNTLDGEGNSLGDWLTGQYAIDYFALPVTTLDTAMSISLRLGFGNGKVGTVTRNIVQQGNNSSISTIFVSNNPTLPELPGDFYGSNVALFSLTEFQGHSSKKRLSLADYSDRSKKNLLSKSPHIEISSAIADLVISAIADLVGWVEVTKPNIAFISYLNFWGFTSFNPTYILFHTNITIKDQPF